MTTATPTRFSRSVVLLQCPGTSFHRANSTTPGIAGVPALLGCESAYQAERRNEYDYFEVHSADEVLETLLRLRGDPAPASSSGAQLR